MDHDIVVCEIERQNCLSSKVVDFIHGFSSFLASFKGRRWITAWTGRNAIRSSKREGSFAQGAREYQFQFLVSLGLCRTFSLRSTCLYCLLSLGPKKEKDPS